MIDGVTIFAFFVLGFLSGMSAAVALTIYIAKRSIEKDKKVAAKGASLTNRMKRIKEITGEQLDLARRADGPQKNSLDGKYKNSLFAKIKSLDEEKVSILRSILADGHDPELSTMDESGVVTHMKLSEYMAHMGISVKPEKPKTEKVGKFTVYRGGKDDGNNTTH